MSAPREARVAWLDEAFSRLQAERERSEEPKGVLKKRKELSPAENEPGTRALETDLELETPGAAVSTLDSSGFIKIPNPLNIFKMLFKKILHFFFEKGDKHRERMVKNLERARKRVESTAKKVERASKAVKEKAYKVF